MTELASCRQLGFAPQLFCRSEQLDTRVGVLRVLVGQRVGTGYLAANLARVASNDPSSTLPCKTSSSRSPISLRHAVSTSSCDASALPPSRLSSPL